MDNFRRGSHQRVATKAEGPYKKEFVRSARKQYFSYQTETARVEYLRMLASHLRVSGDYLRGTLALDASDAGLDSN